MTTRQGKIKHMVLQDVPDHFRYRTKRARRWRNVPMEACCCWVVLARCNSAELMDQLVDVCQLFRNQVHSCKIEKRFDAFMYATRRRGIHFIKSRIQRAREHFSPIAFQEEICDGLLAVASGMITRHCLRNDDLNRLFNTDKIYVRYPVRHALITAIASCVNDNNYITILSSSN